MNSIRTPESEELADLAEGISAELVQVVKPRAVMLIGSAAMGISDRYSDLDLAVYHDRLPSEDSLAEVRERLEATSFSLLGPRSEKGVVESFMLRGVECQLAHSTLAGFEEQIEEVLVRHIPGTVTQKILEGLVYGRALRGGDVISAWKRRAAYPAELRVATVEHFLRIRPIWFVADRLDGRDAVIFLSQMRIDAVLNIFGILAGLNGEYFSTFQFKRMRLFAESLTLKPESLADRLDHAFSVGPSDAAVIIEELARETYDLVRANMPEIDLASVRYPPGHRQQPWS